METYEALGSYVSEFKKEVLNSTPEYRGRAVGKMYYYVVETILLSKGAGVLSKLKNVKYIGKVVEVLVDYSKVLNSASSSYKGSTVLGHALSKHAGRNPGIWGKLTGNPSTWHSQALKHFDEIMNAPGNFIKTPNSKGINFLEKRLPDGRGIRLNMDGTFKGFID